MSTLVERLLEAIVNSEVPATRKHAADKLAELARQQESEGVVVEICDFGVEGFGFFIGEGKTSEIYSPMPGTYRLTRIEGAE